MRLLRNEGPVGGPGMREMLGVTAIIYGRQMGEKVALVTDGRFCRVTRGICAGHVSPEAPLGAPLALVYDGDRVRIDIANRRMDLIAEEGELIARRAAWRPPCPVIRAGFSPNMPSSSGKPISAPSLINAALNGHGSTTKRPAPGA